MVYYEPSSSSSSSGGGKKSNVSKFLICVLIGFIFCLAMYGNWSLWQSIKSRQQQRQEDNDNNSGEEGDNGDESSSSNQLHHQVHRKKRNHNNEVHLDENRKPTFVVPQIDEHEKENEKKDDDDEDDESSERRASSMAAAASLADRKNYPLGKQIRSLSELESSETDFFVFQEIKSLNYLARPLNTSASRSSMREKIFHVRKMSSSSSRGQQIGFSIRGHTRLYLTSETNDRVAIDRLWARGYEKWFFHFSENGLLKIQSAKRDFEKNECRCRYITVFEKDGRALETIESDSSKAAQWKMFSLLGCNNVSPPDQVSCWGESSLDSPAGKKKKKKNKNKKKSDDDDDEVVGGKAGGGGRGGGSNKLPPAAPLKGPLRDSPDTLPHLLSAQFPLFGSPKPLPGAEPKDPHNPFDVVTIAERTIRNWASMHGMVPVMFSTDPSTVKIVEKVNAEIEQQKHQEHQEQQNADGDENTACKGREKFIHFQKHKTVLSSDFEIHRKYQQPTYRGLFKRAFEMFPDAPAVMYSNGDILFSPTLAQTIRRVASYFETEKVRRRSRKNSNNNNNDDGDDNESNTNKNKRQHHRQHHHHHHHHHGRHQQQREDEDDNTEDFSSSTSSLKGWMIVGQRVNCVVPPDFVLKDDPHNRYTSCAGLKELQKQQQQKFQYPSSSSSSPSNSSSSSSSSFDPSLLLPQWVLDVEDLARRGQLFQGNAEDYFIVSRDLFDWDKIPEFIVGGVAFDNWITSRAVKMALKGEAIVVDAVKTITALHQNDAINIKKSHESPKSRFNLELAAAHGGWTGGYTADAPLATEKLPSDGTVTIYDKHALLFP